MTVSEPKQPSDWQTPAQALARWIALLMGWVWLGAQGQRLGWSWASGLLPVALWWACRLLLAPVPVWRPVAGKHVLIALGGLTAAGAWAITQAEAGTTSFCGLLVLAVFWALWSGALDQQAFGLRRCQRPWAGWPPIAAALVVWWTAAAPQSTGPWVAGALLAATCLACAAPARKAVQRAAVTTLAQVIPQTAMGLMMGSLWLSGQWCASVGWSMATVVGVHLTLMAVLPALIRLDLLPRQLPSLANQLLPLALVMVGCSLLWNQGQLAYGMTGMALLALAWALPARTPKTPPGPQASLRAVSGVARCLPLIGPLTLLAIGAASPFWGPQAMLGAYAGLGLLAGFAMLRLIVSHLASPWRGPVRSR